MKLCDLFSISVYPDMPPLYLNTSELPAFKYHDNIGSIDVVSFATDITSSISTNILRTPTLITHSGSNLLQTIIDWNELSCHVAHTNNFLVFCFILSR